MSPANRNSLVLFIKLALPALFIVATSAHPAIADCIGADYFDVEPSGGEEITFEVKNDGLIINGGTDRGFTNGLYLGKKCFGKRYTKGGNGAQVFSALSNQTVFKSNFGYFLGQDIYTPEDIQETEIIDDDRPYAGWLFIGAYRETYDSKGEFVRYSLSVGCLGPCSYAEQTQVIAHEIFPNSPEPMGWDHQVGAEVGFVASFEHRQVRYSHSLKVEEAPFYVIDIVDSLNINAGNIFNNISYGATVRFGEFKPYSESLGFAGPDNSLRPDTSSAPFPGKFTEWYFFFEVGGAAILYDATMQGGLFSDGDAHSVRPENFLFTGELGVALDWERLSLQYSLGLRGPEFVWDKGNLEYSLHGALSISYSL